jgi:hypothetical protein
MNMFIIRGSDAPPDNQDTPRDANAKIMPLAFDLLTSCIDEVRQGIDDAGFTLQEVYSVWQDGNSDDPVTPLIHAMCSPENNERPEATGAFASFVQKAWNLTRLQRAGVALALHEAWIAGESANHVAILARFEAHGIHLRGIRHPPMKN